MIDISKAKEVFANYIKKYNPENEKIAMKIIHINKVAEISKEIAIKNNFNKEEQKLAELIGLLHDIGRFEQIRLYNTFIDQISVNHAEMGIKVLFEDGLIREFLKETDYDEIIKTAILNHNIGRIDNSVTGRKLDFCKIIRDADKVDIYRVLTTENMAEIYEKDDISNELISDEIFREFKEDRIIDYKNRKSAADVMVSHFTYIFDFNFDYCLKKIKSEKYIEKLLERANFKNEDTVRKFSEILEIANNYIDATLS